MKDELLKALQGSRAVMLGKLDGLSEYDRRRPLTPSGTNLLGLVKHLAGMEYGRAIDLSPWPVGACMVLLGAGLVALTIALGG